MLRLRPPEVGLPRLGLGVALLISLASCAELATVADVVFPSAVPGLPADRAWTSLPVRRWLTESGIEPVAISACIPPECAEPAVAGLFRARGADAAALRRAAADPAALTAALTRRRSARGSPRRPPPTVMIAAAPAQEGGLPGFVVRMGRRDGSREAAGYVAVVQRPDATQALVIVAASEASARDLARAIVPRL